MSDDEIGLLIVSLLAGACAWGAWYLRAARVVTLSRRGAARAIYRSAPALCALALLGVLLAWSSHDVRRSPPYLALYTVFGSAWVGALSHLLLPLGMSARQDVLERGNLAAAWAVAGAQLGFTLSFAGGNIGDGPGWWVVLYCAILASAGLLAAWRLLESLAGVAERVTVDRDLAAGLRLAGFLVGAGIVLGRSVAGDWHGADGALADFARQAWPALVLVAVAATVERVLAPSPGRPRGDALLHGLAPAAAMTFLAALYALSLGPW